MGKRIAVIGLGYIGLPTAILFAKSGCEVLGVDINQKVIDKVSSGELHIEERDFADLLKEVIASGRIRFSTVPDESDVFIIAVQTPLTSDCRCDLSYVESAVSSIVPFLKKGNTVILESTIMPGTTENLVLPILERSGLKVGEEIALAHAPERVLPGRILEELVNNNRIIGGIDKRSAELVRDIYRTFVKGEIYLTDAMTAELAKLAENTFRDVNIALANSLAMACRNLGKNVWDVISLANKHPRINYLSPGPGVGGHCIPIDPWFLIESSPHETELMRLSRRVNDRMPDYVTGELMDFIKDIPDPKVSILGLTYKAKTDDARESPALEIMKKLADRGIRTSVHDPHLKDPVSIIRKHADCGYVEIASDIKGCLKDSDCLLLAVDHVSFSGIDPGEVAPAMRSLRVFDCRNFLDVGSWMAHGFSFYLLGRGEIPKDVIP